MLKESQEITSNEHKEMVDTYGKRPEIIAGALLVVSHYHLAGLFDGHGPD